MASPAACISASEPWPVELGAANIVEQRDEHFHYRPADAQMAELLDRLAAAHSASLVEISLLIHSKIDGPSQRFADAFLFRPNA